MWHYLNNDARRQKTWKACVSKNRMSRGTNYKLINVRPMSECLRTNHKGVCYKGVWNCSPSGKICGPHRDPSSTLPRPLQDLRDPPGAFRKTLENHDWWGANSWLPGDPSGPLHNPCGTPSGTQTLQCKNQSLQSEKGQNCNAQNQTLQCKKTNFAVQNTRRCIANFICCGAKFQF